MLRKDDKQIVILLSDLSPSACKKETLTLSSRGRRGINAAHLNKLKVLLVLTTYLLSGRRIMKPFHAILLP